MKDSQYRLEKIQNFAVQHEQYFSIFTKYNVDYALSKAILSQ